MNNELNSRATEPEMGIRPRITVEEFIAQFDQLEAGSLFELPHNPTDQEAQQLAKLKTEVSVMELLGNKVVIAKGTSKTQTAFTRGELLVLKPKKKAHTHPVQPVNSNSLRRLAERVGIQFEHIDQEMVARMGIIIPGPDDLTVGSVGAATYEIWNEYGKTMYSTYSLENEDMLGLAQKMIANLYASKEFMTILVANDSSIKEKVAKMNGLLKSLGLSFEFQPWAQDQT